MGAIISKLLRVEFVFEGNLIYCSVYHQLECDGETLGAWWRFRYFDSDKESMETIIQTHLEDHTYWKRGRKEKSYL